MNQKLHICVYAHNFPGRSETFVREHVLGLARRGHKVTVVSTGVGEGIDRAELAELDEAGISRVNVGHFTHRLSNFFKIFLAVLRQPSLLQIFANPAPWARHDLLSALKAAEHIKRLAPDLVHVHFGVLAAQLHAFNKFINKLPRIVVTWHGYDANMVPNTLGSNVYHDLFAGPYHHTVGSLFMSRRLVALGANQAAITKIPMGIDLKQFSCAAKTPRESPLRILSVGRLARVKGHNFLVDAVRLLKQRGIPVSLSIVGMGPCHDELQSQIDAAGLTGAVTLVGALPTKAVADAMCRADVFALASVEEESGAVESQDVVFAEAQAAELPVIACDVGGVSESLIEGQTGILCESKNVSEIADAIEFFHRHRDQLMEFGAKGRLFSEEHFGIEAMLARFESLYQGPRTPQPSSSDPLTNLPRPHRLNDT